MINFSFTIYFIDVLFEVLAKKHRTVRLVGYLWVPVNSASILNKFRLTGFP